MELKYKNKLVSNWEEMTDYVFKVLYPVLKSEAYDESLFNYSRTVDYTDIDGYGDADFKLQCEQNEVSISVTLFKVVVKTIYRDNACVGTFVTNGKDGSIELSDYNFDTGEWVYNDKAPYFETGDLLCIKNEEGYKRDQDFKNAQVEILQTYLYRLLRNVEYQWHNIRDEINYKHLKRYDAIMNFSSH